MYENRKKEKVKACIAIGLIILAIAVAGIIVMKYYVEGDTSAPFKLSKVTVVSTVEGVEKKDAKEKWNLDIYQNNDVYFSIEKNEESNKEVVIDSVSMQNIKITKIPKVGQVRIYMPNSSDGRIFSYEEEYIVKDNKLTYKGAGKTNTRTLEVGNQGGTIVVRFANAEIGNYVSNDDEEIKHDGTMISKLGLTTEDVKFSINFDLVIKLKNKDYISNISLDLPVGEDLAKAGTTNMEITEGLNLVRIN